jgi:hypothetical protein
MCCSLGRPIEDSTDSNKEEREKVRKEDERMDHCRAHSNADRRERKKVATRECTLMKMLLVNLLKLAN